MIPECPLEVRAQTMLVDLLTWLVLGGIRSEAQTMGHFWCWFHDTRTFGNSLQFATEVLGHLWILYVEDDVSKIVIFHTKLLNYRDFLHSRSQGTQRTVVKSSCRRENDTFSINRICRISGVQPPVRGPQRPWLGDRYIQSRWKSMEIQSKHTKPQCDSNGHCGQRYANMLRW
jgi:hypothetical protein